MPTPEVVVVAEVQSLGAAVYELLLAGGLAVASAPDLDDAIQTYGGSVDSLPKVLVSAPANRHSETARRWADGPFATVPLVVVGSKDGELPHAHRIHFVTLPLAPDRFLDMVRRLAGHLEGAARSGLPSEF
jgi:hypothetical protein